MGHDQDQVREFASGYAEAWCSHDVARVAGHFVPGGTIAVNGGEPTDVTEVARSFIDAFPDIRVFMDDVVFENEHRRVPLDVHGDERGDGEQGSDLRVRGVGARR